MRENTLEGVSHEEGLSTDDEETNSEIVARQQSIGLCCGFVFHIFKEKERKEKIFKESLKNNRNIL